MRLKFAAALIGGIVVAAMFIAPAPAHADTVQGCGNLQDMGNNFSDPIGYGQDQGGYLFFQGSTSADSFCNVSTPNNGVFEITDKTTNGCVGEDLTTGVMRVESSAACAISGGQGYPWDQWTVVYSATVDGWPIFELRNNGSLQCLYDDLQQPAVVANCITTDRFEWFYWPQSGLPGADG
jgi:hypothetical protein